MGSYHTPLTVIVLLSESSIVLTVISFFVSVPVLSEHIVVTAQSVSTDESFFTITDFPASTEAPSARAMVMVVGSHSGTAAMAIDTAYMRFSTNAPVPSL